MKNLSSISMKSLLMFILLCPLLAVAQLVVTVSPPKITGQKVVVKLAMKNNLADKVESARAVVFLLDDQGKMVGQSTKWVIGQNKVGLEPTATNTFNFVITSGQPFTTTNLTAKVSFTRIVLSDGQVADIKKTVNLITPP
jgi:hypothetical protein